MIRMVRIVDIILDEFLKESELVILLQFECYTVLDYIWHDAGKLHLKEELRLNS